MNSRTLLWLSLILVALLVLEGVRRLGNTAACYVSLRYDSVLLFEPKSRLWEECGQRHLHFLIP